MEKIKEQRVLCDGIISHNDKFLIIKRSSDEDIFPDKWEFPSGKIEFGEDPKDALAREVKEETGLKVLDSSLIDVRSYVFETERKIRHNIELTYVVDTEDIRVSLSDAHSEYAFVSVKDLDKYDIFDDMKILIKKANSGK